MQDTKRWPKRIYVRCCKVCWEIQEFAFEVQKYVVNKVGDYPVKLETGKLKKVSGSLTNPADNGIEIFWDNNSPSPTTTIALAGKRRRRRQNNGEDTNETIAYVVQKLSESTSPIVDPTRSALLELWVSKDEKHNECDEEFTSPPSQTRQEKRRAAVSTPLNQRRISKRSTRKTARQFMLEIRKLMDEIQKSDLSSSSNQSQSGKEQEQSKSTKIEDNRVSTDTNTKSKTTAAETLSKVAPESKNADIEGLRIEDSFEWTEDDMDEFILTCQLSSSGKASLDAPEPTKPQFGLSPSVTLVPETQIPSDDDEGTTRKPSKNTVLPASPYREKTAITEEEKWEENFNEDDSLLESVAQEFELSQKSLTADKSESSSKVHDRFLAVKHTDKHVAVRVSRNSNEVHTRTKPTQSSMIQSHHDIKSSHTTNLHYKNHNISSESTSRINPSGGKSRNEEKSNSNSSLRGVQNVCGSRSDCSKITVKNSDENHYPSGNVFSSIRGNSSAPLLNKKQENSVYLDTKDDIKSRGRNGELSLNKKSSPAKRCNASSRVHSGLEKDKQFLSNDEPGEFECLLSDNLDALMGDFNFEESLGDTVQPAPVIPAEKACTNSGCSSVSGSGMKKTTYSKDEIERKRLEAQRRRRTKLQSGLSRTHTRNAKLR